MSFRRIRTAVIPAAGLGTRWLPATKVIPKEMMPVGGRPIAQFAVEEAAASGLETVILVLRRGKEVIAEHFQSDVTLDRTVARRGSREDAAAALRHLSQLVDVRTVWQEAPLGLADAIRATRPLIRDEPFAVILPDALIDSAVPCTLQLMACYAKHAGCVVATRPIDSSEVDRFGILDVAPMHNHDDGGRIMRVNSLVERPQPGSVSSRYGIFGRYILEPEIFGSIERTLPGLNGELQLTDALMVHIAKAPVYAYQFEGTHYDAGSKLGFVEATVAYALKDPEIATILRKRLASRTSNAATPVV
jgi:UTP--glucose-1-phosphate uridylyltransferase